MQQVAWEKYEITGFGQRCDPFLGVERACRNTGMGIAKCELAPPIERVKVVQADRSDGVR